MRSSVQADISFVLQAVPVPEHCLLSEVLAWCAFKRIPIVSEDWEFPRSPRPRASEPDSPFDLGPDECKLAGLPPEAWILHWTAGGLKERGIPSGYDRDTVVNWREQFTRYLEPFKLKIMSGLRDGRMIGEGIRTSDQHASKDKSGAYKTPQFEPVQDDFWTMEGVDWDGSVVASTFTSDRFTWVRFPLRHVFETYPLDVSMLPCSTVYRVGGVYIEGAEPGNAPPNLGGRRGRLSNIPWEHFHLEVAALVRDEKLPAKVEAAIEHFREWFHQKFDLDVSRTTIGDKLRPYYYRFVPKAYGGDGKSQT